MITISLDEAYIFDLLAILELKKNRSTEKIHIENYNAAHKEIQDQIGKKKLITITESKEYINLIAINNEIFDLVNLCQQAEGLAALTAETNNTRFVLKNNLQNKFFKNSLQETKIDHD